MTGNSCFSGYIYIYISVCVCVCVSLAITFLHIKYNSEMLILCSYFMCLSFSLGLQDPANGNQFLKVDEDDKEIGFQPKNVFTALANGTNYVEWGGEVFSPPSVPSPPMGSVSKFLTEDTKYDAYCRKIKIIDENTNVVNAWIQKIFKIQISNNMMLRMKEIQVSLKFNTQSYLGAQVDRLGLNCLRFLKDECTYFHKIL